MTEIADTSLRGNRPVPSDLNQVIIVAWYDILKHLRSRRLVGILVIVALIIVAYMAIPPLIGQSYSKDPANFAGNFIGFMPTIIIIIATLFAGDAIVSEYQNRTGYLLFPNPVKRWSLFFGKYLAALGLAVFILLIYYGIVVVLTLAVTGGVSELTFYSLCLALLYACATIALGFLLSSVLKGATGSLVLTFIILILIMPMIAGLMSFTSVKPDFILSSAGDSINFIMQTPYPQDFQQTVDIGNNQTMTIWNYYAQPWTAVGVMAGYTIICFTLGYIAFSRREMLG